MPTKRRTPDYYGYFLAGNTGNFGPEKPCNIASECFSPPAIARQPWPRGAHLIVHSTDFESQESSAVPWSHEV